MRTLDYGELQDPNLPSQCQWEPAVFVQEAIGMGQQAFLRCLGTLPLLLVRCKPEDDSLLSTLQATSPLIESGPDVGKDGMGFHTRHVAMDTLHANRASEIPPPQDSESSPGLPPAMRAGAYFLVPAHKRNRAQPGFRISVGRAANMDIVLRHESISKFHAWIYCDPSEGLFVQDASSTNGTWINHVGLGDEDRKPLRHGDMLHFGEVEAHVCFPHALWEALTS